MAQTYANTKSPDNAYKISFKRINRAALAEVRVHKKLAIITLVLFGVALLMFAFDSGKYMYDDEVMRFSSSPWGIVFAILGIGSGFFTVLNVFQDMNNQQLCDVAMTLPIKASERYLSKLMCLLYIHVIPLLVSTMAGNGLGVLINAHRFAKIADITAKTVFIIVFGALAASMFIMAVTVFCICCTGSFAESAYFSIIMIFVINLLPITFAYNIIERYAGFDSGSFDMFNMFSSDAPFDFSWWGFLFPFRDIDDIIPHCLIGIAISFGVMMLALLIYKKRDARTVGTPISNKVFFEIMMALSSLTIFAMFVGSHSLWWGVVFAAVIYIIINIVVCRARLNFLAFLKWSGKFVVTAAAFFVLASFAVTTGGFGYINTRPEAKYLEGASFSILIGEGVGRFEDGNSVNGYYYAAKDIRLCTDALSPEQADEVMKICKKHLAAGASKMNPMDNLRGSFDLSSASFVNIWAGSATEFGIRPSPQYQFRESYTHIAGRDEYVTCYYLAYSQSLYIPLDEAESLRDELLALDWVYEDTYVSTPEAVWID